MRNNTSSMAKVFYKKSNKNDPPYIIYLLAKFYESFRRFTQTVELDLSACRVGVFCNKLKSLSVKYMIVRRVVYLPLDVFLFFYQFSDFIDINEYSAAGTYSFITVSIAWNGSKLKL